MMKQRIVTLGSGVLFGAGLALGGMTNPARVRGFLDIFGAWDPTLAFVMGGAVIVMALVWRIQPKLATPLFAPGFALPDRSDLTSRLVIGSALFGIGWGIAGLCPGPAFAAVVIAPASAATFIIAMLVGMMVARVFESRNSG